jgi:hypothetical protein
MSEYQYYEFLAIERPLTEDEIDELRALSTRANITPVSFTNIYNWGNFKGNPDKLMQLYFDTYVYVTNWMSAIFKVRLPIEALSEDTVKAMEVPHVLDFSTTKTHWIITWRLNESENYDRFVMEDGISWMARLAPIRDELLSGDIRSLYIGWLGAVTGEMDDDEMEAVSISGLGSLTAAQQALAEFLEVDPDLLAGAGMGSPAFQGEELSERDMDRWIDALPRDEVKVVLKNLLEGKRQLAERSIRNKFAVWQRSMKTDKTVAPRRTVAQLRQNAEKSEQIRLEKQDRDRRKQEAKRRKEREEYLQNLSKDFPNAWKSVHKVIERGSGPAYDEACRVLVNMSEAYVLQESKKPFQEEIKKLMAAHMRRRALIERLVKAGIWEKDGHADP